MKVSIKLEDVVGIVYVCQECGRVVCDHKAQGRNRFACPNCKKEVWGVRSFQMKDSSFIEITKELWSIEIQVVPRLAA